MCRWDSVSCFTQIMTPYQLMAQIVAWCRRTDEMRPILKSYRTNSANCRAHQFRFACGIFRWRFNEYQKHSYVQQWLMAIYMRLMCLWHTGILYESEKRIWCKRNKIFTGPRKTISPWCGNLLIQNHVWVNFANFFALYLTIHTSPNAIRLHHCTHTFACAQQMRIICICNSTLI